MNTRELREVIQLMQEHKLSELEIERNGFKIRLKKASRSMHVESAEGELVDMPITLPKAQPATTSPDKADENATIIRSPMVGTFYAAPAPDRDSYISKGSEIKEGDVLCIVEAMKLMNEIKSEISGRVIEILIKNGQPVEFDQPLFKIQKA